MTFITIFTILIVHWIADFILQTDKQAKGKSSNWSDLITHTFVYSVSWLVPIVMLLDGNGYSAEILIKNAFLFSFITFICHTVTDYFTSRLNKYLLAKGDHHNFFVSVGFDQLLHYFQLFITYKILT